MSSTPDPSVIAAIRRALEADPTNAALRLHLVELLIQAGRTDEALSVSRGRTEEPEPAEEGSQDPPEPIAPDARPPDSLGDLPDTVDELLDTWDRAPAPGEPDVGELTTADITLSDVGGLDEVKARIERSFLGPMRHPELREAFSASLGGGLLLYGPPGCGKTFLARALAGEMGAKFYNVGLSDVLDMWIGSSERNLSTVFATAREHAPCVLFFDELDALGIKRSHLRAGGAALRGVVNQLLAELDGVTSDNDGLYVLGATNHPWDIDTALLRPGRFDRLAFVPPPDEPARRAIVELGLRGRPQTQLDIGGIVKRTEGWSGADLTAICDAATELAMERSMDSGEVSPITTRDLTAAFRDGKPSVGPWLEQARNYVLYANQSGMLDDLADFLRSRR